MFSINCSRFSHLPKFRADSRARTLNFSVKVFLFPFHLVECGLWLSIDRHNNDVLCKSRKHVISNYGSPKTWTNVHWSFLRLSSSPVILEYFHLTNVSVHAQKRFNVFIGRLQDSKPRMRVVIDSCFMCCLCVLVESRSKELSRALWQLLVQPQAALYFSHYKSHTRSHNGHQCNP